MFSLEHCIVFRVHLIVFIEHSIFFLEHSNFFWSICQIEDTKKIIECSQKITHRGANILVAGTFIEVFGGLLGVAILLPR